METLTLTVPQSVTDYRVNLVTLDWAGKSITILVTDGFGKEFRFQYSEATAVNMMTFLNKANLSVQSFHARVLNQLVADGFLPVGTISGTPD